jgi:isopenicillin-N epimerase
MEKTSLPTRRDFLLSLAAAATGVGILPAGVGDLQAAPKRAFGGALADEAAWERVRSLFPLREGIVPMNAANLAPAPRSVVEAVISTSWDLEGDVSHQNRAKFSETLETARARMATYLNADTDEIALVRNASEANNIIVGGLRLGRGDEVLVFDQNHQTNNVAWEVNAARYGFSVRTIGFDPLPESPVVALQAWLDALTPRTRVITFSDLSNTTGLQLPTRAICHAARERGIYVHVDGAQTLGAVPRDLHDLGCDSYAASAHKWLMGPKEVGVLYARSERIPQIWPGVVGVGWGNGPETTARGARKLETLGQRNDATLAGLIPTLDLHAEIGAAAIGARIEELAKLLKEGLASIPGATLVTPLSPEMSGGVVVVSFAGRNNRSIYETIYTDHGISGAATGGVRLCPHIYTTRADVERAVEAVDRASRQA